MWAGLYIDIKKQYIDSWKILVNNSIAFLNEILSPKYKENKEITRSTVKE